MYIGYDGLIFDLNKAKQFDLKNRMAKHSSTHDLMSSGYYSRISRVSLGKAAYDCWDGRTELSWSLYSIWNRFSSCVDNYGFMLPSVLIRNSVQHVHHV